MCKSKSHLVATAAGHARKSTRYLHTLFDELCIYARTQVRAVRWRLKKENSGGSRQGGSDGDGSSRPSKRAKYFGAVCRRKSNPFVLTGFGVGAGTGDGVGSGVGFGAGAT